MLNPIRHIVFLIFICFLSIQFISANSPIEGLLERIDKGASKKIKTELVNEKSDKDFFEINQVGKQIVVRGNNYVSIATGIHWYLKYYVGVMVSWNNMNIKLPSVLPKVSQKVYKETAQTIRYDLNYCTYSYTMAFWDWERWEKEIDWMALHGINLPLSIVGTETVWYNVLKELGYNKDEINDFIAGPAFQAWWLMNNLEGWGGPNPDSWYARQVELQKKILARMKEFGIEPVFAGYSGMVPNNASEKLKINASDRGLWCGFRRPSFLQPTDPNFDRIANIYYQQMGKLFGKAKYYSIDPFHEGSSEGVDIAVAGKKIWNTMKKANSEAKWVIMGWGNNPRPELIEPLPQGDVVIVDLMSDSRPMWGDTLSPWYRKDGFGKHDWLFGILPNFGGNIGLFGKMDRLIDGYYSALTHSNGKHLKGIGYTMEGSENNPVIYEFTSEFPWREEKFTKDSWLSNYPFMRYGKKDKTLENTWLIFGKTAYSPPYNSTQEGTSESVFCARPSLNVTKVSTWGTTQMYYNPDEFRKGVELMLSVAESYKGNKNFEYDLIDIVRQAIANEGYVLYPKIVEAYKKQDKVSFENQSKRFLNLILLQDELLSTQADFMVGKWIERAKKAGATSDEKKLYEWNARTLIATWGDRNAAINGGLGDYSNREWSGILKDLYHKRWKLFFDSLSSKLNGNNPDAIDDFAVEEAWTHENKIYPSTAQADPISTVKKTYRIVFQ